MTPNSLLTLKPQQRKKTKFANRQAERRPFELEDKLDSDAIALWVEQSHITAVEMSVRIGVSSILTCITNHKIT